MRQPKCRRGRAWFTSRPYGKFPFSFQRLVYPWRESIAAVASTTAEWTNCNRGVHVLEISFFSQCVSLNMLRLIRDLFRGESAAILKLVNSLKVSLHDSAIALLFYLNAQDPAHGAVIIGFMMDASPTNNLIVGMQFLIGCVFGSVYGFLCQSITRNFTENMIWIVVIAFTTGLGSCGPVHGEMFFFMQFFALSAMAPGTAELGMIRAIQQNVGAIAWLVIVCNVVFPQFASADLNNRSINVMISTRKFFHRLIESLFDAEDAAEVAAIVESPLFGRRAKLVK